eukprot:Rhum_TRINITY_DN13878_c0_g1::Rhum_TRINITY_DN13878_c0_g1_i1::g.65191::m.65191
MLHELSMENRCVLAHAHTRAHNTRFRFFFLQAQPSTPVVLQSFNLIQEDTPVGAVTSFAQTVRFVQQRPVLLTDSSAAVVRNPVHDRRRQRATVEPAPTLPLLHQQAEVKGILLQHGTHAGRGRPHDGTLRGHDRRGHHVDVLDGAASGERLVVRRRLRPWHTVLRQVRKQRRCPLPHNRALLPSSLRRRKPALRRRRRRRRRWRHGRVSASVLRVRVPTHGACSPGQHDGACEAGRQAAADGAFLPPQAARRRQRRRRRSSAEGAAAVRSERRSLPLRGERPRRRDAGAPVQRRQRRRLVRSAGGSGGCSGGVASAGEHGRALRVSEHGGDGAGCRPHRPALQVHPCAAHRDGEVEGRYLAADSWGAGAGCPLPGGGQRVGGAGVAGRRRARRCGRQRPKQLCGGSGRGKVLPARRLCCCCCCALGRRVDDLNAAERLRGPLFRGEDLPLQLPQRVVVVSLLVREAGGRGGGGGGGRGGGGRTQAGGERRRRRRRSLGRGCLRDVCGHAQVRDGGDAGGKRGGGGRSCRCRRRRRRSSSSSSSRDAEWRGVVGGGAGSCLCEFCRVQRHHRRGRGGGGGGGGGGGRRRHRGGVHHHAVRIGCVCVARGGRQRLPRRLGRRGGRRRCRRHRR